MSHPYNPVLRPAFARLDDAHNLWHQAEVGYFDPNSFRIALNACIQALRSVTFVLQKTKGALQDLKNGIHHGNRNLMKTLS
jgi:predicted YcjX-like family ATPase